MDENITRKIKINGHSVYEDAKRSLKSKREQTTQRKVGKNMSSMSREEITNRLILMKERDGAISEDLIKRDSVLVLHDVIREFGTIAAAKKAVKEEIYRRKGMTRVNKDELKEGLLDTKSGLKPDENTTEKETEKVTEDSAVQEDITVSKKPKRKLSRTHGYGYTAQEIYDKLLSLGREFGKVPSTTDIHKQSKINPMFPSAATVVRKLNYDWRAKIREDLALDDTTSVLKTVTENPGSSEMVATIECADTVEAKTMLSDYLDALNGIAKNSKHLDALAAFQIKIDNKIVVDIAISAKNIC